MCIKSKKLVNYQSSKRYNQRSYNPGAPLVTGVELTSPILECVTGSPRIIRHHTNMHKNRIFIKYPVALSVIFLKGEGPLHLQRRNTILYNGICLLNSNH